MKAINSPPKPLPSTKDLAQIFKEYISTKPKSEESFILDYKTSELNGKTFYIAYNKQDKSAVGYINIFLRTIASANEEQKSKQIQRLLEDRRFAVAQFNENLKLTKLSYHTEVLYVINSGEFEKDQNLINGYISKKCESTSEKAFELKFFMRNKKCLQQTYVCEDEKIIFTGEHKFVKGNGKFHLTDGAIKIENNRFNTNITVKNGKLISLECYQSEKNGHSFHVDFENNKFFCKIYQNGEYIRIDLNFSEPQTICNAIYNRKNPQSFALDTVDINNINNLISNISKNIKAQSNKLFEPKLTTNQSEHDDEDIDKLVEYVNGIDLSKTKPLEKRESPLKPTLTSEHSREDSKEEYRNSDEDLLKWHQRQEEINKPLTTSKSPIPKTLRLSQSRKIEIGAKMLMAALPELKSVQTEFKIGDSSSSSEYTELPISDSAPPSSTPNLPKASDFYKTWENYFVTEVLQAIANILNEDKRDFIISDDKKNESYKLLHSLMATMSVDDLCEGLALSEEKQEILLQKLLTKSKANYSDEMARFTARKAMNKTYAECNRKYEDWRSGEALQKHIENMQRAT